MRFPISRRRSGKIRTRWMEQSRHILRQLRLKQQDLPGDGMNQPQSIGVERRAGNQRRVLRAVQPIPRQGTANISTGLKNLREEFPASLLLLCFPYLKNY